LITADSPASWGMLTNYCGTMKILRRLVPGRLMLRPGAGRAGAAAPPTAPPRPRAAAPEPARSASARV